MRTFFSMLLVCLLSSTLLFQDAFAKRFGGGRSFGVQRSMSSYSNNAKPASGFSSQANKQAKTNRWGGMLGGLLGGALIGGLLSSLFMGNGLATGLLTWLILGALVLFLINLFRRKMPQFQGNMGGAAGHNSPFSQNMQSSHQNSFQNNWAGISELPQNKHSGNTPNTHFMSTSLEEEFLREAKVKFIRLQAAYDQKNNDDLREFTTPEVLAEITMQFQEQEGAVNQTEVVSLEAELLGTEPDEQNQNIQRASVKFTGLIKENSDKAEPLNEIWHFQKEGDYGKWIVSGVQQIKPW